MLNVSPIRAESLGERLANELRRRIIVGDLAAGTRLVEEEVAESFRVSRGPVRDAIKICAPRGWSPAPAATSPSGRSPRLTSTS